LKGDRRIGKVGIVGRSGRSGDDEGDYRGENSGDWD
jgi:hypothetical protein